MSSSFVQLLLRWAVLALGVTLAAKLVPGIRCDDGMTLVVVVALLSFFNAILKPLLLVFTLPFIVMTMGLGVIVINALLFLFVGRLVDGFHVSGFGAAFWGSIIVSVTNIVVSALIKKSGPPPPPPPGAGGRRREAAGDVIDI